MVKLFHFYEEALKYSFTDEIDGVHTYELGSDEYSIIYESTKDCLE